MYIYIYIYIYISIYINYIMFVDNVYIKLLQSYKLDKL